MQSNWPHFVLGSHAQIPLLAFLKIFTKIFTSILKNIYQGFIVCSSKTKFILATSKMTY